MQSRALKLGTGRRAAASRMDPHAYARQPGASPGHDAATGGACASAGRKRPPVPRRWLALRRVRALGFHMLRSAWFAAASSRTDRAMRVASAPPARGASCASPMRARERRARLATLVPIGLIAPARRRCRRSRMHEPIACDRRSARMRGASRGRWCAPHAHASTRCACHASDTHGTDAIARAMRHRWLDRLRMPGFFPDHHRKKS